jgi:hypothetical protein
MQPGILHRIPKQLQRSLGGGTNRRQETTFLELDCPYGGPVSQSARAQDHDGPLPSPGCAELR